MVEEQKLAEALKKVEELRQKAQAAGDEEGWTRGLVQGVQLRTGLHSYEEALRFLKEQDWPRGAVSRAVLNLFYARSLVNYLQAYSWEINQREKVASRVEVDLKAWTRDEIFAEAQRAYLAVWQQRETLGGQPLGVLAEYLEPNNYPREVRGTLRDAVSYLFVELLADTALWRPEEANELFALDLKALIAGAAAGSPAGVLGDSRAHPLAKLLAVLDDLEAWHAAAGQRPAALEARLERLRRLHSAFTVASDRALIRDDLEKRLNKERDLVWWAAGQALLAEMVRDSDTPDNLIKARAIAEEGRRAYPDSQGGKRCLHIVKAIEAPEYRLEGMATDGPGKRSLGVMHKNFAALYLRAYPVDLVTRIESAKDYNLLPAWREVERIVAAGKPVARWQVELPATPDYRLHRTYITPPLTTPGLYLIAASLREDFAQADNQLMAVNFLLTSLVIVSRQPADGGIEATVLEGKGGRPVPGAEVSLYRFDWQVGHRVADVRVTGENGTLRFPFRPELSGRPYFLLAKSGGEVTIDADSLWFNQPSRPTETAASLIFTDRSVYRPLQKVLWKVLAYRGGGEAPRYRVLPDQSVTLSLYDANGDKVDEALVTTNEFGSAAGEFTLPAGRLLGEWRIETSPDGVTNIRVEEYKRPTFEVKIDDPAAPLRLNRPAILTGTVRYYFGLPVASGTVKWLLTREPVYPWWWEWFGRASKAAPGQRQTVAAGSTALAADGSFRVGFTPAADERRSGERSGLSYRFRLSADVTDEGGETRSADRTFRLGFIAVEARLDAEAGFFLAGKAAKVKITRTDLNGTPRAGAGTWRLVALDQPTQALLPADQPLPPAAAGEYRTPGDSQRPRWNPQYSPAAVLRAWQDGEELAHGKLSHDENGEASVTLTDLPPGAYRLCYETLDDFGATYQAALEIVVAAPRTVVALPAALLAEQTSVPVGGTARFLAFSGVTGQLLFFDRYRDGQLVERRRLTAASNRTLIEIPIGDEDRGGFAVRLWALADHQLMEQGQAVFVPWDDRALKVELATFRDKLTPGGKESWRVTVKDAAGSSVEARAAELLAYMYDRSLDIFAPHHPPDPLQVYPTRTAVGWMRASLGAAPAVWMARSAPALPSYVTLIGDRLKFYDGYGIGGPGRRRYMAAGDKAMAAPPAAMMVKEQIAVGGVAPGVEGGVSEELRVGGVAKPAATLEEKQATAGPAEQPTALRSDFAETAFWRPQLVTGADGSAAIEFTVPDSVTAWNIWVHAVTKDLRAGSLHREARSVKELMVRPYLPRFLREGDHAEIKVVVNNAGETPLTGKLTFEILDPSNERTVGADFGLAADAAAGVPFNVAPGGGTNVSFAVTAPRRVGIVAFRVKATAGGLADGELRPLPLLPGRVHLAQSRFVTLRGRDRREMTFADLERNDDPTLVNDSLVVTVDAQLFYTALAALPYLVNYPYECTEQTLNRFVSTGILTGLYDRYPAVAKMAQELAKRETRLETWDAADPNRKMALEETPWLVEAKGGGDSGFGLTNVLDPRIAKAEQQASLAKLRKAQTAIGGFPWWPGGPPSPYMTLYIMYGLAKAAEFGVEVPRDMVENGWKYLAEHFREEYSRRLTHEDCCWEFLTFLDYVATCYPDPAWMGNALSDAERKQILDFSFAHWKQHSPYLKGLLALTLKRMGRPADAQLVFDSVMDSAKTTQDEGTFWAPEDRAWLWYNDTIESHSFALRTLTELAPTDARCDGLVQWLLLNKKLNHWKSTRATAEVIYSLAHYMKAEGTLGAREDATVTVGGQRTTFVFEPDRYTGKGNQIVVPGDKIDPATTSTVVVEKESKGFAFASATWHFSTERLPAEARGDLLAVERRYFKRERSGSEVVLRPLAEGASLAPGDEVEVQLSLRAKHPCEYVHLRDPRGAGFEPVSLTSEFKWDLGIGWYEEVRDSGANFFFENLPQGEYTFKYRLRATMSGGFKVSPATVQSMYAPEFAAYSSGAAITIGR